MMHCPSDCQLPVIPAPAPLDYEIMRANLRGAPACVSDCALGMNGLSAGTFSLNMFHKTVCFVYRF